ncbi:MAG: hypothetical protein ACJ0BJ_04225 [Pirellulales bacterium]
MSRVRVIVLIVFCTVLGGVSFSGRSAVQAHEDTGSGRKNVASQNVGSDGGISSPQPDVVPQIAECTNLLFDADFSEGGVPEEWIPLHGTQWAVVEGVLQGRPSTNEFQQKRVAAGNSQS